jgi:hypothetical protein
MLRMSQVVKFPDMQPPNPRPPIPALPPLSEYRQTAPALAIPKIEESADVRRFRRKRLFKWFGVAVGLHAILLLVLWLTPPMRLKWGPPPEAWVQVTSLPKPEPVVFPAPQPAPVAAPSKPPKSSAAKSSSSKPKSPPQATQPARSS